ncbi:methyl-accepting chemotaxis (MCP) signaling domain-containing protein (plasmid) [Rhizobium gallicum bv. gallicum R602sp]|uniref:Methyl-accepting chemotaxis (MCP) signaling domain-containing protein n=1 Tax=Rhizobium gallicum bv. gallicum R602sp TaxID=1041138 RepID=A0A0B4X5J5_9HYPH|nr:methyl-accepting chemotaxis (MCP) signaling domain-containing protein [Rhizobium gallicum bv. gallicum R602sp]
MQQAGNALGQIVVQVHEAMTNIRSSSVEIGNIIVSSMKSHQTNLLALNAGIEAARAGGLAVGSRLPDDLIRGRITHTAGGSATFRNLGRPEWPQAVAQGRRRAIVRLV